MLQRLIEWIFNFAFRSEKKARRAKNLRDAAIDLGLWSSMIRQTNCFCYQTWRGPMRKMTRPISLICRQVYPEDICSFSSGCEVFFLQVIMRLVNIFASYLFRLALVRANDCVYSTPNGTIDLRTLSYPNRPRYTKIPDTNPRVLLEYSFNPCSSYSTNDTCKNAAACASKYPMLLSIGVAWYVHLSSFSG